MKLPELKSRRKIRDAKICQMYLTGASQEEIAMRFDIHQTSVGRILYKHSDALKAHENMEKAKRINRLTRIANKCPDTLSKGKDILNVLDQLRKEVEGDKPTVQVNNTSIKYEWKNSNDRLLPTEAPNPNTRIEL